MHGIDVKPRGQKLSIDDRFGRRFRNGFQGRRSGPLDSDLIAPVLQNRSPSRIESLTVLIASLTAEVVHRNRSIAILAAQEDYLIMLDVSHLEPVRPAAFQLRSEASEGSALTCLTEI
jgi:hypothetical protein